MLAETTFVIGMNYSTLLMARLEYALGLTQLVNRQSHYLNPLRRFQATLAH